MLSEGFKDCDEEDEEDKQEDEEDEEDEEEEQLEGDFIWSVYGHGHVQACEI